MFLHTSWRVITLFTIVVGLGWCCVSATGQGILKLQSNTEVSIGTCWTVVNQTAVFQIRNNKLFRSDLRTQNNIPHEYRPLLYDETADLCKVRLSTTFAMYNGESDKYSSDAPNARERIFFDTKKTALTWLEGGSVITFNAVYGKTEQKLPASDPDLRLVAKLGALVLLERPSEHSMLLLALVDTQLFYLSQCQECIWAVDTKVESVYALSASDLTVDIKHDLDALIVAMKNYETSVKDSANSRIKRAIIDSPSVNRVLPEDESRYLWIYISIPLGAVSSVLLIAMCVEKTKSAKQQTKVKNKRKESKPKRGDSPGKNNNDSDSRNMSVNFSLSQRDLISSREGVASNAESRPDSPRAVYIPIDTSISGPGTVAIPMPQTVYSHFLPPSARSRMVVPFEDIKYVTEIGSGNFGKVYLAKWQALKVAVKVTAEDNAAKFEKELSLMLHLTPHPNVVQILGFSNDGFHPLIMMELCPGGSLASKIKDPRVLFPIARIIRILFGVARGMFHLHKSNIVHRDLAARNVLLTKDGEPKLSDFGFSRLLRKAQGRSRTMLGPLCWMSPEALQTGTYSTKLDVWSFGCLIYELIARKEPHEGADLLAIGPKIRDENLTPCTDDLSCESEVLMQLMKQCWSVDPDSRPDFQSICDILEKELGIYEPETVVLI